MVHNILNLIERHCQRQNICEGRVGGELTLRSFLMASIESDLGRSRGSPRAADMFVISRSSDDVSGGGRRTAVPNQLGEGAHGAGGSEGDLELRSKLSLVLCGGVTKSGSRCRRGLCESEKPSEHGRSEEKDL